MTPDLESSELNLALPKGRMQGEVFALLEAGCSEVWRTSDGGVVGFEPGDDAAMKESVLRSLADRLLRRFAYAGTAGDRNVHVMSGRIE